jgi:ATP-dependent DNA helicase RecG
LGQDVILHGTVKRNPYWGIGFEMDNPEYEIISEDDSTVHMHRIVPVYRATSGLSVRQIRTVLFTIVHSYLEDMPDPLPLELRQKMSLPGLSDALLHLHFPGTDTDLTSLNTATSAFHRRLAFDELFMLELGLAVMKNNSAREKGISFHSDGKLVKKLRGTLPFTLTHAQEKVFGEILRDMQSPYPMHRLIQGDVGCGKTIVALMAMLEAAECGYQSALMAPTEILAEQHFMNIRDAVEELGLRVSLFTGSMKDRHMEELASGDVRIAVGTHALIQEGVRFRNLGLVIIDEQHRFGVMQRAFLRKKGINPDVLVMTATPIPRTLSLTLYGDLDCSVIDELPPNRYPVQTLLMKSTQKDSIYAMIREEVHKQRQVYVVYPVIEESEKTDLKSAIIGQEAFQKFFPEFTVGLIHGRMKPAEREGDRSGVDVPNATLMIIIHAERFGLSQLHQLRGRIGRSSHKSRCILVAYGPGSEEARRRLNIMVKSSDGFRIAEEDLAIRGPGEFLGTRQSGLPDLRVSDIIRDALLLQEARREAFALIDQDPDLNTVPLVRRSLDNFWKGKIEFLKTG